MDERKPGKTVHEPESRSVPGNSPGPESAAGTTPITADTNGSTSLGDSVPANNLPAGIRQLQLQVEKYEAELLRLKCELDESNRRGVAGQQVEERFRTIMSASLDVIYRRDMRIDQYDCVSPSVERLTGYTPEEFTAGGLQTTIGRIHPDDLAVAQRAISDVLNSPGGTGSAEYRYRRKDGEYRWFADAYTVTRDDRGRPLYWVGVVRDVTELKRAQESLQHSRDELEREVAVRTEELRSANSELRTRAHHLEVLTAKLTTAEHRERQRLAAVVHDDLQQTILAARLQVSAMARSDPKDYWRQFDALRQTLEQAIETTRCITTDLAPPVRLEKDLPAAFRWLAWDLHRRHGLNVALQAPSSIERLAEPVTILLFTAARELLLNVVRHSGVATAELELCADANTVELIVRDQGQGMADPSESTALLHDGFGLFSIRQRVELLGGKVTIVTRPEGGTCVMVSLPIAVASAGE